MIQYSPLYIKLHLVSENDNILYFHATLVSDIYVNMFIPGGLPKFNKKIF